MSLTNHDRDRKAGLSNQAAQTFSATVRQRFADEVRDVQQQAESLRRWRTLMLGLSAVALAAAGGLGYAAAVHFTSMQAVLAGAVAAGASGALGLMAGRSAMNARKDSEMLSAYADEVRKMSETLDKQPDLLSDLARQMSEPRADEASAEKWRERLERPSQGGRARGR